MAQPAVSKQANITKEGFLKRQGKRGVAWNLRYFILTEGSLHYYKDQNSPAPSETLELKDAIIENPTKLVKKKNSFSVQCGPNTLVLSAESPEKTKLWVDAITNSIVRPPCSPPQRVIAKKKGAVYSSQSAVTDKAASSGIGKKIIREFTPETTLTLLDDLKKFITEAYGPQKAKEVENIIYKVAIKVAMLYKNKYIAVEEFGPTKRPVLSLWSCFLDGCEMKWTRDIDFLSQLIHMSHRSLDLLLRPHLSPRTMVKLNDLMEFIGSLQTLETFFEEKYAPITENIAQTLRSMWDTELSAEDKISILKNQITPEVKTGRYTDPGMYVP